MRLGLKDCWRLENDTLYVNLTKALDQRGLLHTQENKHALTQLILGEIERMLPGMKVEIEE